MKLDINSLLLFSNTLLYFFWFLKHYVNKKRFTPYSFLIFWYSIIAFIAYISYSLGIFSDMYMGGKKVNLPIISPIGLLLVYFSFHILLYPVKKISNLRIEDVKLNSSFYYFEYFAGLLAVALSISCLPFTLQALAMEAVDLYNKGREDGLRLMPYSMYLSITLFRILYFFFLPYFFYKLKNKITLKYAVFLAAAFVTMIQISVISASRGMIFVVLGSFFFTYVFFSKSYRTNVKRVLNIWFITIIMIAGIAGLGITISRAEAASLTAFENIVSYFGESFNQFSFNIWGNESIKRTNGEVYFPETYSFFTDNLVPSFETTQDKVDYWEKKARIGVHNNFAPMFGKLYMEFGWYISLIIIFSVSLIIYKYFNHKYIRIYQFPLVGFLFSNVFFYSILTNTFRESIFKDLIYTYILSLFLKYFCKAKNFNSHIYRM